MSRNLVYLILLLSFFGYSQNKEDVFFDFNKDYPNDIAMANLNHWIQSNSDIQIISISGYCDGIDNNAFNKKLASRRINSILTILKENSISLNDNLKKNVVGEDFEQSKIQSENRKVTIEYIKIQEPIVETSLGILPLSKTDVIVTLEDKIEVERASLFGQFEKAKKGDRITIYNINFEFNSENIIPISLPLLEELLFVMERNPNMEIKIYGHICCNSDKKDIKLSSRRALKILNYLNDNGIYRLRLDYTGVGSNNPIFPIPEKNETEKLMNRRVEIEILRK